MRTVPAKPDTRFRTRPAATQELDARRLARELAAAVEGEVRFSPGSRALYTTGGSNYRQLPIGIVIPRTVEDVVAAVEVCSAHEAPVLSRGGGTSLAGQTANVAVVLDFSKYLHDILEIDPDRRLARVQPGVILDHLRHAAERPHHLTYGPDPSTHTHCTLGGMIGNNSCGVHSVMTEFHGSGPLTADQVVELECLTYRGERFRVGRDGAGLPELFARPLRELADRYGDRVRERYPQIPRRVSGYNLDRLLPEHGFNVAAALTGTESTCVTILEATVELVHSPPARSLVALGYEDAPTAGDHVMDVRGHEPLGLEGIDDTLLEDMTLTGLHDEDLTLLPEGRGYLLVEFGGETKDEADAKAHDLMAAVKKHHGLKGMKLYDDPPSEKHVWEVREAGLGATAFIPGKPDTYEGWEDSAVPPRASAITCASCASSPAATATRARSTGTTARAASTPAGTSTSSRGRGSGRSGGFSTTLPTSSCRWAGRCPASTETASHVRSCSRRCSARTSSRGSASSNRSGIRTGR
jgi:FAD/FMN-containing dehydrogenase